jgi:putative membrane protein
LNFPQPSRIVLAQLRPMPPKLKEFLQRWAITTVAVLVAAAIISGIRYDNWLGLLIATLVLGLMNAFLRPLLVFATVGVLGAFNVMLGLRAALVTLPLQILSFGFFLLVINAALLLFAGHLVSSFQVDGFWTAFKGGLVISIVSLLLNSLTGTGHARIQIQRGKPRTPGDKSDPGDGPVIDV